MNDKKYNNIALIGAPNAGKSTLVNQIIGSKISIVSPKVQTTRASIRGIHVHDNTQIVFIDTPGIFTKPQTNLERTIVREAYSRLQEADILAVLIDVKKDICKNTRQILDFLEKEKEHAILIINKVDTVNPEKLLPLAKEMHDSGLFKEIFMISAKKGDGVDKFLDYCVDTAKEGPWGYEEDQITDAPIKFFAAEVTREKLFMNLQHEIPYSIAVETEKWEETKKKGITIHQVIYVLKDSQKAIILGKNGEMIKKIGRQSRIELSEILECQVNLFLFVKVRENWIDNPSVMKEMGL